jgi:hypothetical protein
MKPNKQPQTAIFIGIVFLMIFVLSYFGAGSGEVSKDIKESCLKNPFAGHYFFHSAAKGGGFTSFI